MSRNVVIIGGGISGLSSAYFLAQHGIGSTIIEKSNRLGGLIKTDLVHGCRLEAGPDSYISNKPAVTTMAERLDDLSDQIIGSNDQARRVYIVRKGKLVPMPKGMVMMVPGEWASVLASELFSFRTKMQFVSEWFSCPRERKGDVSIETFVSDHFGKEVLEYVAEPLLSGVYGGNASQLSTASVLPRFLSYERIHGSLIRAVRSEVKKTSTRESVFRSFRNGMQSLIDALAGSANVLQAEATRVEPTKTGWRAHGIDCDQLVLATPSHVAARLLEGISPELACELMAIPYSSCILVTLVYERKGFSHKLDGFGFLVPVNERHTIAAATWISTKFPSRVPENLTALRAFIVDPEASSLLNAPDADLVQLVRNDFQRLMGIGSAPLCSIIYKWPQSMPQYVVGHAMRQRRIKEFLTGLPKLHLTGNAYDGIGIPDCVRLAEETAKRIAHSE